MKITADKINPLIQHKNSSEIYKYIYINIYFKVISRKKYYSTILSKIFSKLVKLLKLVSSIM